MAPSDGCRTAAVAVDIARAPRREEREGVDHVSRRIMGILNVTPDSFSDGGRSTTVNDALRHARDMASDGAGIVDVGGESTRPGARPVSVQQELDRVVPVIEALCAELPVLVSIDTYKPEVMREAVRAGAGLINDVKALREPHALETAAELDVPICLMHMRGEPQSMQAAPCYDDVVMEVKNFLAARVAACVQGGIARQKLLLDPGFGFGKTLDHNIELLARLDLLVQAETPLLVGLSRKSMIGAVTGQSVDGRLAGGLAAVTIAALKGATVFRVHDVAATVDALRVVDAVLARSPAETRHGYRCR